MLAASGGELAARSKPNQQADAALPLFWLAAGITDAFISPIHSRSPLFALCFGPGRRRALLTAEAQGGAGTGGGSLGVGTGLGWLAGGETDRRAADDKDRAHEERTGRRTQGSRDDCSALSNCRQGSVELQTGLCQRPQADRQQTGASHNVDGGIDGYAIDT